MDYHSMSLVELKQLAKDHKPKIKQYYIKKRHELIQLLTMKTLPESFILEKKKRSELIQEAKEKGYKGIYNLKRHELLELLHPGLKQNNKDNDHAEKHDNPEHGKS
jgi:hypothetical protein